MAIVLSGTTGIDAGSLPVANTGKISAGAGLPVILNTAGVDRVIVDVNGDVRLASSPAQFDNDTSIATTAFVQGALGNHRGLEIITANRTLTAADAGKVFLLSGTGITITFPNSTTLPSGCKFTILTSGISSATFAGSSFIDHIGASVTSSVGYSFDFYNRTDMDQYRVNKYANFSDSDVLLSVNGYQKLPGGLIIQWGLGLGSVSSGEKICYFPITFPTALLSLSTQVAGTPYSRISTIINQDLVGFGFSVRDSTTGSRIAGQAIYYLAIGF